MIKRVAFGVLVAGILSGCLENTPDDSIEDVEQVEEAVAHAEGETATTTHITTDSSSSTETTAADVLAFPVYQVYGNAERFSAFSSIGDSARKDIYISIPNNPNKTKTKYLFFFAAGQQVVEDVTGGTENGVTGQYDGYKSDCGSSCERYFQPYSLFGRIYRNSGLSKDNSYYAIAMDTQLNYEDDEDDLDDLETAYFNWLRAKIDNDNIEMIYMAGASRGGCLVARLAARFKADTSIKHVPVVVQGVDAACNPTYDEMGALDETVDNPVSGDWSKKGRLANLNEHFDLMDTEVRSTLVFKQVAGGEEAGPDGEVFGESPRGFVLNESECTTNESCDRGWYRHVWVTQDHTDMCQDTSLELYDGAFNFYEEMRDAFL